MRSRIATQPWLHPDVEVRESPIDGRGLFTTAPLDAGVVVVRLGGRLVGDDELRALIAAADADRRLPYVDTVTIEEGRHLVLPPGTPVHYGNHSCDPTMWHVGPVAIATRRRHAAGDELTVDYATQSGLADWAMTCACGTALCRGVVTGEDWRRAELQQRYAGHWLPALAGRVATRLTDPG
jgi:uncharacterized protein